MFLFEWTKENGWGDGNIGYGLYPYAEDEKGHWRHNKLAINNPSSAEFIDYVSHWVIAALEHVDKISIEGNL